MKAHLSTRTLLVSTLLCLGILSQPALASTSDIGTLTNGIITGLCPPPLNSLNYEYAGYDTITTPTGSYSPTGLTGGGTVVQLIDLTGTCPPNPMSQLRISGFSSDPGSSWLISATCVTGSTQTPSGATYNYDSSTGTAWWMWTGTTFNLRTVTPAGATTSCTIIHN